MEGNMFNKHCLYSDCFTGGLNENKWLAYTPMLSDPLIVPEFNSLLNLMRAPFISNCLSCKYVRKIPQWKPFLLKKRWTVEL